MTTNETKSGSNAGVVILVVLLLLGLPCIAGLVLVFLGGAFFVGHAQPVPAPLLPLQAFPAPVPGAMPDPGSITVNSMQWSQNLFDQAEGILTKAKFEQLQPGMTYDEVLKVLEIPEDRRPPDMELIGPDTDVELKWVGGTNDELSITVKMKGKTVVGKEQTGLK